MWVPGPAQRQPNKINANPVLGLGSRFDPDLIVYSLAKPLFAPQVFLGRLDRDMTQQKLNLFQFAASTVTETGARSSEIMWRKLSDSQSVRVLLHYVPDHLLRYFRSPDSAAPTDAPEQFPLPEGRCG